MLQHQLLRPTPHFRGTQTSSFMKLKALLPEYLQDFAEWAYYTGWRAGSIRSLRWEDIHDNVLTVRPAIQ